MSNLSPFSRRPAAMPSIPTGDVLGTYDTYLEAQGVVDRLSKAEFDVRKLSIVGHDLTTVERVTGRLTYGRRAGAGAASGAWLGLFFGVLFFLFTPIPNFANAIASVVIGAGVGMLFSILMSTLSKRGKDYTSTHQVLAASYQVVVDPALTAQANELLARPEPTPKSP